MCFGSGNSFDSDFGFLFLLILFGFGVRLCFEIGFGGDLGIRIKLGFAFG